MRYLLKQKLLAFGDDFYIKDEAGNDVYFVDGKVFSIASRVGIPARSPRDGQRR